MNTLIIPPCPKCGVQMTGGAPPSGSGIQWECHNCGHIETHPADYTREIIK